MERQYINNRIEPLKEEERLRKLNNLSNDLCKIISNTLNVQPEIKKLKGESWSNSGDYQSRVIGYEYNFPTQELIVKVFYESDFNSSQRNGTIVVKGPLAQNNSVVDEPIRRTLSRNHFELKFIEGIHSKAVTYSFNDSYKGEHSLSQHNSKVDFPVKKPSYQNTPHAVTSQPYQHPHS